MSYCDVIFDDVKKTWYTNFLIYNFFFQNKKSNLLEKMTTTILSILTIGTSKSSSGNNQIETIYKN